MKYDYQRSIKKALYILIVASIAVVVGSWNSVSAQGQDLVTKIDCETAFPECQIYLAPWRTGGGLTSDKLDVRVDGQPLPLNGLEQKVVGVQVAFALDEFVVPAGQPGASVRRPGISGQPKFVEFRSAAIDFFLHLENNQALDTAWLAAFRTGEPSDGSSLITSFPPIADWVNGGQINVFYNELIDYEPAADKNTPETPLYDLIAATLKAVQEASAPPELAKHVIIFTDGFERIETLGLDLLLRQALDNGIRLHTVMLGEGSQDLERTLQKIAQPTGGLFVRYRTAADMQGLWAQVSSDVQQNVISITLPSVDARQIQVTFNGQTVDKPLQLPRFAPPTVAITAPTAGARIIRKAPEADTQLSQVEPREMPITVTLEYPSDGANPAGSGLEPSSRIEYVEYTLGALTLRQQEAPFDQVFFPIEELDSGIYTLEVRVQDRYAGRSDPAVQSIQIDVVRPESPSAAPEEADSAAEGPALTEGQSAIEVAVAQSPGEAPGEAPGSALGGASGEISAANSAQNVTSSTEGLDSTENGAPSSQEEASKTAEGGTTATAATTAPSDNQNGIGTSSAGLLASLQEQIEPAWSTLKASGLQYGGQLLELYQNQPRYLMVPVLLLVLLFLFGLQIRSVRSGRTIVARQNFATSDPPNNDITEPEDATEPANEAFPIATLVFVRGEGDIPKEIPLHRQHLGALQPNQWSIGRSYQESDEVIESRRISRLHATITEQHGRFLIRDEGSSGGTYITSGRTRVRRRLEALAPVQLEDSDTINFNSIAYRFEVDRSEFYDAVTEPDYGEQTEPELNIDALL